MNWLDRAIAVVSPQRAANRVRARALIRAYDGATYDRRSSNWRARATSANTEIATALQPLRDRARDLVRNSPHGNRAMEIITSAAVASGITPVCKTGSAGLDKKVAALWQLWQAEADARGLSSFNAMQELALRSIIESGEVVIRFDNRVPSRSKSGVPLQLQVLESDFIDAQRDGVYGLRGATSETKRSRLGVGLGDLDRFTGLWLFENHPGETSALNLRSIGISKFYPADEVLHVFKVLRPGQVRGTPWFAPMLTTAREYADFMDAALVKAKAEACFVGYIKNTDDSGNLDPATGLPRSIDSPDAMVSILEPGTVKQLKYGQEITFAQPSTTSHLEAIAEMSLRAMASAIGVTYDQLTSDLRGANYSSLRAGKLEFRAMIEPVQNNMLIPGLLQPVWDRFIDRAILADKLRARAGGYPCEWVTPAWQAVNPKFDYEADAKAVRDGRMSPQQFVAAWGNDWRKVLDDIAEWNTEVDKRGIVLDTDPRQRTRVGQPTDQQANGAAGGDGSGGSADPALRNDDEGEFSERPFVGPLN